MTEETFCSNGHTLFIRHFENNASLTDPGHPDLDLLGSPKIAPHYDYDTGG